MEWVNRYLDQVGQYLPEDKRKDVTEELREVIAGEVEGLAEARGTPPNADDERSVVARFGHPQKLAQDYHPLQYLIGPALYPIWWQTAKRVAVLILGIQIVLGLIAGSAFAWEIGIMGTLSTLVEGQLWAFVVVTSVFIAIEFSGTRLGIYENWRPENMPRQSVGPAERDDVLTNLFSEGIFLLWWNSVLVLSHLLPESVTVLPLQGGMILESLYWPLNVVFGTAFATHLWVLLKGVWQRPTLYLEIATIIGFLIICAVLLNAPELVVLDAVSQQPHADIIEKVSPFIDRTIRITIFVIAAFTVWDGWKAWRLIRGRKAMTGDES